MDGSGNRSSPDRDIGCGSGYRFPTRWADVALQGTLGFSGCDGTGSHTGARM
jgi:hypothetical protein